MHLSGLVLINVHAIIPSGNSSAKKIKTNAIRLAQLIALSTILQRSVDITHESTFRSRVY